MKVFIFGNEEVEIDSLPIQIIDDLKAALPNIDFVIKDPNEEWGIPEELVMIDTAVGLNQVTAFDNLDHFTKAPNFSMHDFDALTNLLFLKKLGRLKKIKIIGIPPTISKEKAIKEIVSILHPSSSLKSEQHN